MFEFLFEYVDKDTILKYIRLLAIVGFYLIFRHHYSTWAKTKQIKRDLENDKREKEEAAGKDEEEQAKEESIKEQASSFGWGKKTRKNVKLQQSILEEELNELRQRQQSSYDAAEDHDIEDLLED
ncbi:uncharacterized protein PRCAT00002233001 [Priceomyces carsonii]|uniref:uncharacterized protein n=1 Tax=Priceomyces carsonii TaxID=28549 RepID=UPI002EDAA29E|nr:unnamed protein product [Priceomyces carsonii]